MKRRALLAAGGAWLAVSAARSFAQTAKLPRRIAFLHPGTEKGMQENFEIFRGELKNLGHVEGRDISIEARWADGKVERLTSLAIELVARNPALIVTVSSAAVAALKKATASIPIVFATAANPVEQGFVASLGRPGGNITGIVLHPDLEPKMLEVIREALPAAQRLGVIVHEPDPFHKVMLESVEPAAKRLKFELTVVRVAQVEDLGGAFKELAARKVDALTVPSLTFFASNRKQITELARSAHMPLFSTVQQVVEDGGLVAYGTRQAENFRRAAVMVDKILRGAKPGDIAVEQPEKFELVVNLKTAKAIGVKLSPATMLRATRVIE